LLEERQEEISIQNEERQDTGTKLEELVKKELQNLKKQNQS